MQLIRGLINLNHQADFCIATIGNFDGVHLGHQAIIKKVIQYANQSGRQSCVILFEPHPKEVFMGENCPARITSFTEKYIQLASLGVDKLLVLQFNSSLREMAATEFINEVLIARLKIKHLVVGDDFQFGYKRQGNYELLKVCGKGHYSVEPTPTVLIRDPSSNEQFRASSTLVRNALLENNFQFANKILTRRYSMTGKVGYGKQVGTKIGFATANIAPNRRKPAVKGVFLVRAKWTELQSTKEGVGGRKFHACWGVANCGSRPTLDGQDYRLEVHLLGVSPNLYGIELKVDFYAFIREEKKFESVQKLAQQIEKDVKRAKELIERLK